MHLTEIKLVGFKSFVDLTKIPVSSNMSAIVGPNGCGKSNIVDAIRWVIGESSAKQLRGQSMSDVIFNGTTQRKPVGRAMVELHFDNSMGRLTGEYATYTDIVVRREVERDGQSSYFLNGAHCRRRDILDVFLGTGLGPRSYSIIEQGMISQLIESKPEEMRVHLEEVAGISKYKERRRETENRIQHTRDNLARLNDIREELDKQLRHLKRQANAAERYKTLKEEERVVAGQMKALHWRSLEERRLIQQEKLNQQLLVREQKLSEQRHHEAEMDKIKLVQEEAQETHSTVQKRYYQMGEEVVRLEQGIKHHQDELERWRKEYADTHQMWQELEDLCIEQREQICELSRELTELMPREGAAKNSVSEAQKIFSEAEKRNRDWQMAWEECQEKLAEINSQLQVTTTKIEYHQKQKQQWIERQETIATQLQQSPMSQLASEILPLKERVQEKEFELETLKKNLQQDQNNITLQRENNKQQQLKLQNQRREVQQIEAEQAKISALQEAALGVGDAISTAWLTQHSLNTHARLGQKLEVAPGWEKAVETVFHGYFDAVCVDQLEDYVMALNTLGNGRMTLIEKVLDQISRSSLPAETLASKINSDWSFSQWLQGIYVAESVEDAWALQKKLAPEESIITRDGVWIGRHWMHVSHLADAKQGILEREKKLQHLKHEVGLAQACLVQMEQELQKNEAALLALEQSRDILQQKYQQKTAELAEARSQLAGKINRFENIQNEQQRLKTELYEIEQRLKAEEDSSDIFYEKQKTLQQQQIDVQEQRNTLAEQRDHCQEELEIARRAAQREQQQSDELAIRVSAHENQLALLRQAMQRHEKQLTQITDRRHYLEQQLSQEDTPVKKMQADLQEKLTERLSVEQALKKAEASVAELKQRIKHNDDATQGIIEEIQSLQEQVEALRLAGQEIYVRQQTIQEQLQEMDMTLDEIFSTLSEDAEISVWEAQLTELQKKISRLGPINLAAIEEFQSGSERKEYLDKQFQDLTESLDTLEAAIRKIDRESKTRFRETFEKVNASFQTIFPKIFGGGRASLELSEDDLLTTGIIVRAQPPGKRNSTIHMLSGGEKALTAIALIFSMFQLNPAPFCILDEVDAPLDDLNVGRFCQLVKEMAKETQFLIISHNKVTIETADHLMGVTMQEAGVSRLVAVDVARALELVETV